MMRSLYSAVSGLKTHQTRMDVIGNNIANVNTEAFKSSRVTFSEIMYQTTAQASGGNAATGIGGINAKQIGLGVTTGATSISITTAGAAETTGNPFDLKLTDSQTTNFFIVSDGVNNFFTRSGSYYVDGNGFLCMTSTGFTLMGWQVDPATGTIKKDTVSALQVMSAANQTSAPEATTLAAVSGILDKNDSNLKSSEDGYVMTLNFYDDLGYSYTARFSVKPKEGGEGENVGKYNVSLTDVLDQNGDSIIYDEFGKLIDPNVTTDKLFSTQAVRQAKNEAGELLYYEDDGVTITTEETANIVYADEDWNQLTAFKVETENTYFTFNDNGRVMVLSAADAGITQDAEGVWRDNKNREVQPLAVGDYYTYQAERFQEDGTSYDPKQYDTILSEQHVEQYELIFDSNEGTFVSINGMDAVNLNMSLITSNFTDPVTGRNSKFENISVDFTGCKNLNNGGTSTMGALKGIDGDGAGKKLGALTGLSVDGSGRVYGSYDNGNTVLLCQIAVAQFSNASGLEKVGDNCYQTTLNSGEFDGIGVEISADGSSISTGELEMSNVDLSAQFTDMIITQRGFQANSRVITTSDTLLEELINLKR
ncbi:MAG: flagellar hook-basal body complex protein [Agathobacter sp.]|nr:flagellar hook-basal body complex protein [Agathobacter sp.]